MITFPEFTGVRCLMMPFIQGNPASLPEPFRPYARIVAETFLERGEIGHLTIDETHVEAGKSQRGYGGQGGRNVHVEVARLPGGENGWGGNGWGGKRNVLLDDDTMVLIANSVPDTCRVWAAHELAPTTNGDLSEHLDKYPEHTGRLLRAGEIARISIFTPHECVPQRQAGPRQFFRIVGRGVRGREPYFTINPLLS